MALIRATCSDCGDVELRSPGLQLRVCAETGAATYIFRCPTCTMAEVRPAKSDVVEALVVHLASRTGPRTSALAPGVRAITVEQLFG